MLQWRQLDASTESTAVTHVHPGRQGGFSRGLNVAAQSPGNGLCDAAGGPPGGGEAQGQPSLDRAAGGLTRRTESTGEVQRTYGVCRTPLLRV